MNITIKIFESFCAAMFLLITLIGTATAAESNAGKRLVFKGVDRIYIYVNYTSSIAEEELPVPLHRENIESLLVRMYGDRLFEEKCGGSQTRLDECTIQPVRLLSREEYKLHGDQMLRKQRGAPGALNVVFNIRIQDYAQTGDEPPASEAVFGYYLVQERVQPELPLSLSGGSLELYLVTKVPNSIEANMAEYISSLIDKVNKAIVDEL